MRLPDRPNPPPCSGEALDLAHLAAQTADDLALQRELLELFMRQSPIALGQVRKFVSGDPRAAKEAAHKLKGSARAIGAFTVANAADDVERTFGSAENVAALKSLEASLDEAFTAIKAYMKALAPGHRR